MLGMLNTLGSGNTTLANQQQAQQESLAQLLQMYQQAQADYERGSQMGAPKYIDNSGVLGVLASAFQAYRGKKLRREANETATSLADRILKAKREEEAALKAQERAQKQAEREAEVAWRRQQAAKMGLQGPQAEQFAVTGDVPTPARGVPQMTDQGLVVVDPVTGTYRQAVPEGMQGANIDLDPNMSPEERAAAMEAIQRDMAAPLRPYEKPASPPEWRQKIDFLVSQGVDEKQAIQMVMGGRNQRISINPDTGEVSIEEGMPGGLTNASTTRTQGDIQAAQDALAQLRRVGKAVADEHLTYGGVVKGALGRAMDRAGVENDLTKYNAGRGAALQEVEQFFNQYRKLITGAAAAERELQALREATINSSLGPQEFQARYDALVSSLEADIGRKMEQLGGAAPKPAPGGGWSIQKVGD